MYQIIKDVIDTKQYDLSDILKKINTLWVEKSLSDEERNELSELARENANPQNSIDLLKKVEEMDKRIKALEEGKKDEPTEEDVVEYPEYVVGKWYYKDDKISYKGKNYVCIAPDGVVCTWNPDEYPVYWDEITE